MANTIQYNDMHGKRVPLMRNWFYQISLRLMVGRLHPGLILYTSHLLASFNIGRTPVKFNGRKSSLYAGLAGSVDNSIFHL